MLLRPLLLYCYSVMRLMLLLWLNSLDWQTVERQELKERWGLSGSEYTQDHLLKQRHRLLQERLDRDATGGRNASSAARISPPKTILGGKG